MRKLSSLLIVTCGLGFAYSQDDAPAPATEQVARAIPAAPVAAAAAPEVADSPVPLPSLGHFARLWTDSLFTSRALPLPDVPTGPSFTDNLSLSGTFEDHGKLTAILIDKTTSNVLQAYIGEDNEQGFRISKITPGATPDQMRIQLQKGNLVGWVSFADSAAEPAAAPASGSAIPAQTPGMVAPNGARPAGVPMVPQALPYNPPAQPVPPPAAAMPSLRGGMPAAAPALPNDPPLPPQ